MAQARKLRIAVEGCGHGTLHSIYASVQRSCRSKGWDGVDLLIIGGDFQAVRNALDLNCMAVPLKYREIGDFHEYYSGHRLAPFLTIFVGGNHEASNHLFELYYGGWVAPNIYYMGAANVLRLGSLRISGLSGIWKGRDYNKPHFERLPYNQDNIRSIYHTREIDTRKLLNIRSQVDIGISHDWPRGVEWMGDSRELFGKKKHLKPDADAGQLGNVAARKVIDWLRPPRWFAAHLHVKYAAIYHHEKVTTGKAPKQFSEKLKSVPNQDEIELDLDDDDTGSESPAGSHEQGANETLPKPKEESEVSISNDIRSQLPSSFAKPSTPPQLPDLPTDIHNTTTQFLALDKCFPGHEFLQLLEISPIAEDNTDDQMSSNQPLRLQYDPEWLAITRVFAPLIRLDDASFSTPRDQGRPNYAEQIEVERRWIDEHVVQTNKLAIPDNFQITAPIFDPSSNHGPNEMPQEYNNPQTQAFCDLLEIVNPCAATEEERAARVANGPKYSEFGHNGGNGRGQHRDKRGRGPGRGFRGGYRGNRGRYHR